ncbi:MAG: DUF2071 domain-containing protein [Acidobacteriota bacterium]
MKGSATGQHPAFSRIDHRPWPLPTGRWTWRQSWCDLLFAHWPMPAEALRPLVPPELEIDTFDSISWVGVVPFRMEGVMRRPLPDLPWISAFPELNLRLYVTRDGKPGVWFLSLDATNPVAVWAARSFFHLPYWRAKISLQEEDSGFRYRSQRVEGPDRVNFGASYRPTSELYESQPGTLEHWLTERYSLYAQAPDGALTRTEVHHVPWPLQHAEADVDIGDLLTPHGLSIEGPPAHLHFSRRIDVVVWSPERLRL